MREDLLHYLWKFKKLSGTKLHTTDSEPLDIISLGIHNHHSGPDFFNARLRIGGQEWAGNVEMHVKATDWYLHGHDDDPAYDNVILHVVYSHDAEITRRDDVIIPVLDVSQYISEEILSGYQRLFSIRENQFINCERSINDIDRFHIEHWLESMYLQRLERKQADIRKVLANSSNDWEALFFQILARSFGTKVNADAFEQTAASIEQSVVRKLARDAFGFEAVLLGQAGLLSTPSDERYYRLLVEEYAFAKAKFKLRPAHTTMKFFRLRPVNYPTIRLSQLSQLYHRSPHLFAEILLAKTREEIHRFFEISAADFWDTHHIFDKKVKPTKKRLTPAFIDLLIINAIVPIRFAYYRHRGEEKTEELLELMLSIPFEKNKVTSGFKELLPWLNGALHSQAVLELKPYYCDPNRCLHCAVGIKLMREG